MVNALAVQANSGFSPGDIKAYAGGTVPHGWVLADGSELSRRDNAALFTVIGTTYGAGNGTTTFNLPDLRNRLLIGAGSVVPLGGVAGQTQITLKVEHLPEHTHDVDDPGHTHDFEADPHSHGVNDPGHAHDAPEGGFVLANGDARDPLASLGAPSGPMEVGLDDIEGKAASTATATTGITIDDETISGTVGQSETGITIGETGEGKALDILPPVFGINWLIKL